jgi:hypothetical protein
MVRATEALRKENDKLGKLAATHAKKVKEIGNVQNWAEMLEREFVILEETLRVVRGGGDDDESDGYDSEGSWSGSEGEGSGSDGEEGGGVAGGERGEERDGGGQAGLRKGRDGDGDVVMPDLPEMVPLPASPPAGLV